MDYVQSKKLYKSLLLRAGVKTQRAEEASQSITFDDMRLISDICPEWEVMFPYSSRPKLGREVEA